MEEVYIVQAYRTAVGRSKKGKINFVRPDDLGAQLLEKMVKKLPNFNKEIIDDIIISQSIINWKIYWIDLKINMKNILKFSLKKNEDN